MAQTGDGKSGFNIKFPRQDCRGAVVSMSGDFGDVSPDAEKCILNHLAFFAVSRRSLLIFAVNEGSPLYFHPCKQQNV
jgi:hypothetical protein